MKIKNIYINSKNICKTTNISNAMCFWMTMYQPNWLKAEMNQKFDFAFVYGPKIWVSLKVVFGKNEAENSAGAKYLITNLLSIIWRKKYNKWNRNLLFARFGHVWYSVIKKQTNKQKKSTQKWNIYVTYPTQIILYFTLAVIKTNN